jgi:uncharacterized protein YecE (DUF72 family)
MKIYVGTSGYSYKEWQGKFYPEKISSHEMLRFYAQRLGTVEINNTFYRMPTVSVLTSWTEQVPKDFVFAFKVPQVITHVKRLRNAGSEIEYFFRALSVLQNKLGSVLFQFPKSFRADPKALEDFLVLIPGQTLCAFEFRSPSWLDARILELLRKSGYGLCIVDSDENPANAIISTASWGYLRLRRSDYTDADLSSWVEKIFLQKWKQVFIFFKHEDAAKGPELAIRFQELV